MNDTFNGLVFFDETGTNPLPAGIEVTITHDGGAIATAWSMPGGTVAIPVSNGEQYTASFFGTQSPPGNVNFVGANSNVTEVTILGYRSPSLSGDGYVVEQSLLWPNRWFTAPVEGTTLFALASALAKLLETADLSTQQVLSSARLQSSVGVDVDTWVFDFFGPMFMRYVNEIDPVFIGLTEAILGNDSATQPGMTGVVTAFYVATIITLAQAQAQNLSYDGQGGFESQGGYDNFVPFTAEMPDILVWDKMSEPELAAKFGITEMQFVIQIGFKQSDSDAWFLDESSVDFDSYLLDTDDFNLSGTAPDPRLAQLVELKKADGTIPIYLTYLASV